MNPKKLSRKLGKEKREARLVASRFCRVKKGNHNKASQQFGRTSFKVARCYSDHPIFKDKTPTFYESNQRKEQISKIRHQRQMLTQNANYDNSEIIEDLNDEIKRCKSFIRQKQFELAALKASLARRVEKANDLQHNVSMALNIVPKENKTLYKTLNNMINNRYLIIAQKQEQIMALEQRLDNARDHLRNLEYDLELEQEK